MKYICRYILKEIERRGEENREKYGTTLATIPIEEIIWDNGYADFRECDIRDAILFLLDKNYIKIHQNTEPIEDEYKSNHFQYDKHIWTKINTRTKKTMVLFKEKEMLRARERGMSYADIGKYFGLSDVAARKCILFCLEEEKKKKSVSLLEAKDRGMSTSDIAKFYGVSKEAARQWLIQAESISIEEREKHISHRGFGGRIYVVCEITEYGVVEAYRNILRETKSDDPDFEFVKSQYLAAKSKIIEKDNIINQMVSYQWKNDIQKSQAWKDAREEAIGDVCEDCGSSENLHIHHLNDEETPEDYLAMNDVVTLCKRCHFKEHMRRKREEGCSGT